MLQASIKFAKWVGTAPGTTTLGDSTRMVWNPTDNDQVEILVPPAQDEGVVLPEQLHLRRMAGRADAPAPGHINTYMAYKPNRAIDNVQVMVPPWQAQGIIQDPPVQVAVPWLPPGPVPNDLELASTRPYQPYHRGWIDGKDRSVYNLGSGLGQDSTALRWSIAASVISALALATTTAIAVMRFKREKKA